jgi:hypothetical protein
VAVTVAVPHEVVLALKVVDTFPAESVVPGLVTVDPSTPLTVKVTLTPFSGLPLPSWKWNVIVQVAPWLVEVQLAVTVTVGAFRLAALATAEVPSTAMAASAKEAPRRRRR